MEEAKEENGEVENETCRGKIHFLIRLDSLRLSSAAPFLSCPAFTCL